jgi:DNA-binding NarL/FixJ family response regulator
MVLQTPNVHGPIAVLNNMMIQATSSRPKLALADQASSLLQGIIAELMDGVLILTDQQEIVYANDSARRILKRLNQVHSPAKWVPQEIEHICQYLIHSRSLFPNQHWLTESEVFIDQTTPLHIQARWLKLETVEQPYLLLTLEDRYQTLKNISIEEAERYGLTPREKEVWILHRANCTYKQIATELCVTPNTVKKHMRSIHIKRRECAGGKTL